MKYIESLYKEKNYGFICLENIEDVEIYAKSNIEIKSRQAAGFWMSFKSQTFKNDPLDYVIHQSGYNGIATYLAAKMKFSEKDTSLIDFCNNSDSLIADINSQCFKFINRGKKVRVNKDGGYGPIESLEEYHLIKEIDEIEMYNFILNNGNINSEMKITSSHIIIENNSNVPKDFIAKLSTYLNTEKENIQIFSNFKLRTSLFKKREFIDFFNEGVINGLSSICFETTAEDVRQISNIKDIIEYVMKLHNDKSINIIAKISNYKKELLTTELPNIKIIFLE